MGEFWENIFWLKLEFQLFKKNGAEAILKLQLGNISALQSKGEGGLQ